VLLQLRFAHPVGHVEQELVRRAEQLAPCVAAITTGPGPPRKSRQAAPARSASSSVAMVWAKPSGPRPGKTSKLLRYPMATIK